MRNRKFLPAEKNFNSFLQERNLNLAAARKNLNSLLLAALLSFLLAATSAAAEKLSSSEQVLFDALNRERAAQSLPPLQWDEALAKAARQHANRMAFYNILEHQLQGEPDLQERLTQAGARFGSIAENIAVGASPETIHVGWMHSPGHRGNILNPNLTAVGIATARSTGGLFAVQDFSTRVDILSIAEQEKQMIALLTAQGVRGVVASDEARKTCAMDKGISVPATRSVEALRFEAADLNKLPDQVEKRLRALSPQKTEVGACRTSSAPGFAHYRIAILIF
jgi:uncharacterized protein YkwD